MELINFEVTLTIIIVVNIVAIGILLVERILRRRKNEKKI